MHLGLTYHAKQIETATDNHCGDNGTKDGKQQDRPDILEKVTLQQQRNTHVVLTVDNVAFLMIICFDQSQRVYTR